MINHKLRAARERKRWTMAVAAEKIGVTEQTYSFWENDKHTPHLSTLDLLCEAFGMSPEELGFGHLTEESVQEKTRDTTLSAISHLPQPDQHSSVIRLTSEQAAAFISLLGGDMKLFDPSKRATLEQLLKILGVAISSTLVSPLQSLGQVRDLLRNEEILSICATNIPIFWRLCFDGHLTEVEHVLPDYLSPLSALAEQSSIHQKYAASLASKAHQLACMITLQPRDFTSALIHADQAIQYAHISEDPNILVTSLIRKALVYFYLKRPRQRLWAYQEAMQHRGNVSPLLQGRVYIGLAEAHSNLFEENEAWGSLDLAYKAFPDNPRDDPNFVYTHFTFSHGHEALMYLNLNQPHRAWDALVQKDKTLPTSIVPERVELSVRQARALVAMDSLEQGCTYLESAVNSAHLLGSALRKKESQDIYQQMLAKWPNEQRVKELADLFH